MPVFSAGKRRPGGFVDNVDREIETGARNYPVKLMLRDPLWTTWPVFAV
jgi:hypothetical protein